MKKITLKDFSKILKSDSLAFENFVTPLNEDMACFHIDTFLRQCHFLAQILFESCEFTSLSTSGDGSQYEDLWDLGNNEKGDGLRFRSRGLLPILGRHNYEWISVYLEHDFVQNPDHLSQIPWASKAAGFLWHYSGLNLVADGDDIETITRRVNAMARRENPLFGLVDRELYLVRAKYILAPKFK